MRGIEKNLASCPICHQIVAMENLPHDRDALCPRCGSEVSIRKRNSIEKTLAFVVASIIFYIPANLYPMMHVHTFAGTQSDTIISGIIYFLETGSYLIGFVILIASVVVPFLKMVILLYLVWSVGRGRCGSRRQKKRLYQLTELVGRWSMVDVYVVSIMIALVHFGGLTTITAGAGAIYFLIVVILTMLGAMSFDPRLIWDNTKECNEKGE
jgi:paraquat-inducible protein A